MRNHARLIGTLAVSLVAGGLIGCDSGGSVKEGMPENVDMSKDYMKDLSKAAPTNMLNDPSKRKPAGGPTGAGTPPGMPGMPGMPGGTGK
jgi:hypothetical protein